MYPSQIIKKAREMDVDSKYALTCRKRYLAGLMFKHQMDMEYYLGYEPESIESEEVATYYAVEEAKIIAKLKKEISQLDEALLRKDRKDQITDEMIERARHYPVERLIEFDRSGNAIAWCHPDKKPSLHWWKSKNKAYCFPCSKTFDALDVLMSRDGMSFKDAVKSLQ